IIAVSLRPGDKLFTTDFELLPKDASIGNFSEVLFQTDFFVWLINSTIITLLTSFIGVSLAATAAYALSRYPFKMRGKIILFLMATQMMPAVMLLLPLYFMISRLELIDTYAGVVIAYSMTTLPFCIWLLKGYFDTVPRSLEQAAQVDGLTEVQAFWRVVLPLSTPALAIAVLFCFTQAWNEYIVARVILQSTEYYTWTLGLFEMQGDFDTRWGMFAAASVLVTIPVVTLFLYSSKWLLKGLTLGSVKG
ncbi:carbohydrate ABC transporter permease, partial [Oligoflexaceae bacterium]|nr:carbohydrate ABC transporter permease [Oligoflexaceae bacterium]